MAADSRYKMPAETRKFGGKVYKYLSLGTKVDADRWRAKGYSAKLTPWRGRKALYLRK